MRRPAALVAVLTLLSLLPAAPARTATLTPVQVYGAWHCSDDACTWGAVRSVTEFDSMNHWLIDRGDGRPSVNVVILSFVHPLRLLRNATDVAQRLGVGIEIDYEENSSPNLTALQTFIDTYRSILPYDASGANHAARLTIDVAAGDRWLIALNRKATADWLRTGTPVLDYANAMVPARQPRSASDAIANWQEHIDGKPQYSPPVPPLAPAKFTVGLFIAEGSKVLPECVNFANSLQNSTGSWVQTVAPNGAGTTPGVLGYMFWAAERPSTRGVTTQPPNTCEGGVGAGATAYGIPIPLSALRQS